LFFSEKLLYIVTITRNT